MLMIHYKKTSKDPLLVLVIVSYETIIFVSFYYDSSNFDGRKNENVVP